MPVRLFRGYVERIVGYALTIYGAINIFNAMKRVLIKSHAPIEDGEVKNLVRMIVHLLKLKADQNELALYGRLLSILMAGGVIFSTVRTLLHQIVRIMRSFITTGHPGDFLLIFLSQLTGMYLMGSVLLLRSTIASSQLGLLDHVLGGVKLNFYVYWFDLVFLYSCMLSTTILYFLAPPID